MAFKLDDDYIDVATRIQQFYTRFTEGRLTRVGEPKILLGGDRPFIVYTAHAYRSPDDPVPAVGTAWEPIPGPTQFTRDSELMNAETAAWGRAIIAAGIPSKRIASSEEAQARNGGGPAYGPAVSADQLVRLRRAVAYVIGADEGDPSVTAVLDAIERKSDGYLPAIAMQAVGLVGAALKAKLEDRMAPDGA